MTIEFKFCPGCGKSLKMAYPGNDPENGPATPSCKVCNFSKADFVAEIEMNVPAFSMTLESLKTDLMYGVKDQDDLGELIMYSPIERKKIEKAIKALEAVEGLV